MDIIKAFNNNGLNIDIIIRGTPTDPLFRTSDIGNILEISNIRVVTQDFDITEKVIVQTDTNGGSQNISFLTEKGLYKVLFKSRKPIAIQFQNWVCEVIKEIRLSGEYRLKQDLACVQTKLQEAEHKIKLLEESGITENKPCIYIYNTDTTRVVPELKIGYTLNLHTRIKPYKQVCKHGKVEFTYNLINKNIKTVENFIHELLSDFRVKDEVFSLDVEEAKLILLRIINTFDIIKLPVQDRQSKIKQLIDSDNAIIYNRCDKIQTRNISIQTECDTTNITSPFVNQNEFTDIFTKFIDECCIERHDVEVASYDIEGQFRIWSKIVKKEVYHSFIDYLKTKYKYDRLKQQDQSHTVNGYIGIKLKDIIYTKLPENSDEQTFIFHACKFLPKGKVLNNDLLNAYQNWKVSVGKPICENDNDNIKKYLQSRGYTIYTTIWTPNGNGQGYYGLSLNSQIQHIKKTSTTGKNVYKVDVNTKQIIATWSTIAKAAISENICSSKLSRSIKNNIIFNDDYYYATNL